MRHLETLKLRDDAHLTRFVAFNCFPFYSEALSYIDFGNRQNFERVLLKKVANFNYVVSVEMLEYWFGDGFRDLNMILYLEDKIA